MVSAIEGEEKTINNMVQATTEHEVFFAKNGLQKSLNLCYEGDVTTKVSVESLAPKVAAVPKSYKGLAK